MSSLPFVVPILSSVPLGIVLLALASAYFLFCAFGQLSAHVFGINFQPPPLGVGWMQTVIVVCDSVLASAALYVLLPPYVASVFFSSPRFTCWQSLWQC
ncbi:MAG: hypothetical protein KF752_19665 [Pirellulaceae bacterium]|nr:hypothetical protein [Pirellulaceae bacterium]